MDDKIKDECKGCAGHFDPLIKVAEEKGAELTWDRMQRPKCGYGMTGLCCRICMMGPCNISPTEVGKVTGVCGATAETIVARHWARMIAAGTAAHSGHGRGLVNILIDVGKGKTKEYEVRDPEKLKATADLLGISCDGKDTLKIAEEVGLRLREDFGRQEGELNFIKRAPQKRQDIWRKLGVVPRGIDMECSEMLHRTNFGTDQDYKSILEASTKVSLADGWGGSMIATDVSDILFGTPQPVRGKVNLGVLEKDKVNVVVHGHEPVLSEFIVRMAQDKEMLELAKSKGAKGINVIGLCCTANEILVRHGIPVVGSFVYQELAVLTGAIDAMVVDVQCIMQSLATLSAKFHTLFIATSPIAQIEGAKHMPFSEHDPVGSARAIIKQAVENYPKRGKVVIPDNPEDLVAGFSHETINYMLGGRFRSSYAPLNENIMNGRILGVAGVVGCDNPLKGRDKVSDIGKLHTQLVKKLIANDILVVETGCAALACAAGGLLIPEAVEFAGKGLKEVCLAVGIPPVLHSGSCVDNSRILIAATEMVKTGGLGDDISDLPVAGCCPDWKTEKALAIGQYFVASGVFTIFGGPSPVGGSKIFSNYIAKDLEEAYGGKWAFVPNRDPDRMADMIINHIKEKRKALKLRPMLYQ